MKIRKLVLPAMIAAALATPAFAQQSEPQADAAKNAQSQDSRGKSGQKADAPKSETGKSGKKDSSKSDPTREPEEEDDR
ncbi:hypothetical protein [Lysobacter auxotrophicus]|uniref:Uncharacterized protein n=1 Tax=Lysobacter auxotrophicus TaxID=2992573 RepID=A0ABM8DBB0_9GAMM|nr:hypothetical protein [Lysobacter auxotrophicus]BDU15865.1 hypothetical protein LA521A_10660 [Lysobacter auxotrophicus]